MFRRYVQGIPLIPYLENSKLPAVFPSKISQETLSIIKARHKDPYKRNEARERGSIITKGRDRLDVGKNCCYLAGWNFVRLDRQWIEVLWKMVFLAHRSLSSKRYVWKSQIWEYCESKYKKPRWSTTRVEMEPSYTKSESSWHSKIKQEVDTFMTNQQV